MGWRVLYYETRDGQCPVGTFLAGRKDRERAKILSWIALLEDRGPNLPRPYADLLDDGIHELRLKLSGNEVRILYFFCFRRFIVLTHGFAKHVARVPAAEIEHAQCCRTDFLARYDEPTLMEELDEDV